MNRMNRSIELPPNKSPIQLILGWCTQYLRASLLPQAPQEKSNREWVRVGGDHIYSLLKFKYLTSTILPKAFARVKPWKSHIPGTHPYSEQVLKLKLLSLRGKSALTGEDNNCNWSWDGGQISVDWSGQEKLQIGSWHGARPWAIGRIP